MKFKLNRTMRLSGLAEIRLGQSFRKTVLEDPSSIHRVIQTKDLMPNGRISDELMPISMAGDTPKPNVKYGDILVLSRGVRFNAGVYLGTQWPVTAQNMFIILSLKKKCGALPDYVASYINLPRTQEYLRSLAKGATVQHLKIGELSNLRIPLPPIEDQSKLVQLSMCMCEERKLYDKLTELRQKQFSSLLSSF